MESRDDISSSDGEDWAPVARLRWPPQRPSLDTEIHHSGLRESASMRDDPREEQAEQFRQQKEYSHLTPRSKQIIKEIELERSPPEKQIIKEAVEAQVPSKVEHLGLFRYLLGRVEEHERYLTISRVVERKRVGSDCVDKNIMTLANHTLQKSIGSLLQEWKRILFSREEGKGRW